MFELSSYLGLFLVALAAATVLPMQSEAVLVGMLLSGQYQAWLLLLVATVGNVLGAVVNWWLGRSLARFQHKRWFPASPQRLEQGQRYYSRWGYWSLLLSWLPLVGDAFTVIAGVMREPLWRFVLIVSLAKGGRYLVLAWLTI